MKDKLEDMDYTEFKEHLDSEYIKYDLTHKMGLLEHMVEVSPISKKYEERYFYMDNGKQEKVYIDQSIKTKLDAMDYKELIKYLNDENTKYEEIRGQGVFPLDYIYVIPISQSRNLKPRTFSTEHEIQL